MDYALFFPAPFLDLSESRFHPGPMPSFDVYFLAPLLWPFTFSRALFFFFFLPFTTPFLNFRPKCLNTELLYAPDPLLNASFLQSDFFCSPSSPPVEVPRSLPTSPLSLRLSWFERIRVFLSAAPFSPHAISLLPLDSDFQFSIGSHSFKCDSFSRFPLPSIICAFLAFFKHLAPRNPV